jgi:outer membrane protein assembly factor BamD (BamD/ComL family)
MKKAIILILLIPVVLMTGCKPSREKTISRIDILEKSLFAPEAVSFNKEKADSLQAFYLDFIKDYPKDSLTPGYLFKAANIAMNSGNGNKAIDFFDQYIQNYPDQPKASMCMFFKAFIYENMLQNLDKARETYLMFIEKYPAHDFTNDARLALVNLGKTPEMLVREFEEKGKADSLRIADSLAKIKKTKKR